MLKRTAAITVIAAAISISVSTGIRLLIGAEADLVTIIVRLVLPFVIAIPIGLVWFTKLEKLDRSYRNLVKQSNVLARHASTDPLTSLLNRRSFVEQFELALQHGIKGCFLIADIDYLKKINDSYGHVIGDDAIISTAVSLQKVLGDDSLVARIGGDEFCAFVPLQAAGDIDQAISAIADMASFEFRQRTGKPELHLSVSCGYAVCKPQQTFKEILAKTDVKLYRKKRNREVAG